MKSFKDFIVNEAKNKLLNVLNEIAKKYSGFKTAKEFSKFYDEIKEYNIEIEPAISGNERIAPDGTKKWILDYSINGEKTGQLSFSIYEGNPYKKEYLVYFLN